MSPHWTPLAGGDLLFIDGPLQVYLTHASERDVQNALARITGYLNVYCTHYARTAANPTPPSGAMSSPLDDSDRSPLPPLCQSWLPVSRSGGVSSAGNFDEPSIPVGEVLPDDGPPPETPRG